MRAIEPQAGGFAINPNDGVQIAWEAFGDPHSPRAIVFLPTWSFVHSRVWKMQIPYFALQGFRVVAFDGRGNGRSVRPPTGYSIDHFAQDTLAVFDAAGIEQATVVGFSAGGRWGIRFTAQHPERVSRLVLIGSSVRFFDDPAWWQSFEAEPPDREGWNKYNAVHWRQEYRDFSEWFAAQVYSEPHSTKQREDLVDWSLETTAGVLIETSRDRFSPHLRADAGNVCCPTLIVHGDDDRISPIDSARLLHEAIPGSRFVELGGAGHAPLGREPVCVNLLIHDFIGRESPACRRWQRAMSRSRRALFVSSPIGLGHAQRDLAIARELRVLIPGLEIEWLAQHPVTSVLAAAGECVHPLSAQLAGESPHIESEMTGEHELNVFQAWRRMDEILLSNFHVFLDAARDGCYDLWIGDEAWEVDYYLHENPELKSAPFAWLTDFVGWLPMPHVDPAAGAREACLTADYNAEMIEHVARFPAIRDVSLFIGEPDDIVPQRLGPGLPRIRQWTEANFDFTGYVRYFDARSLGSRAALRERFGFRQDENVAVAAVGGTSVGAGLLRRIVDAYPSAREREPNLRLIVVCGPRINPAGMPERPGVEYRGYVHNLYELLAAADVALVQGGLSTTMELVAAHRPFLYFPLTHHFEQNIHVAYRLERYGVPAWARVSFAEAEPQLIAERLARALAEPVQYQPIRPGGARRAAEKIAALVR